SSDLDRLFERLELFAALRASRRRLQNQATFAAEAARIRPEAQPAASPPPSPAPTALSPASDTGLLASILDGSSTPAGVPDIRSVRVAGVDLGRLVDEVVAPYVLPKADPRQGEFVAAVDAAAGDLLRRLLHADPFQRLEAAWRQLWRITRAVTGTGDVQLHLLDVTRRELAADLAAASPASPDSGTKGLHRLVLDRHVRQLDGQPLGLVVVLEAFGTGEEDCNVLAALGGLAESAGAALLADASPETIGQRDWTQSDPSDWQFTDPSAASRWNSLRQQPQAMRVGLAAPRPLVRLPYGERNAAENIAFEELVPPRRHSDWLWGSAALGVAELIGLAFRRDGRAMRLGTVQDLDDLPAAIFEEDGEKQLLPGAEVFLTTTAGEALVDRGVIPLLSYQNRHAARVLRFTSLAAGSPRLVGPWSVV
ncbi:MAG: type VI secretion system contractile sheath large subunit, partial [Pirellulaceae bacterium]